MQHRQIMGIDQTYIVSMILSPPMSFYRAGATSHEEGAQEQGLLLLCALPVVQFATTAFADYARYTTINQIFGVQIENLKFFSWWWTSNIFVYIFMAFSVVSALYLMCKPRDTPPSGQELKDRLRSRRG